MLISEEFKLRLNALKEKINEVEIGNSIICDENTIFSLMTELMKLLEENTIIMRNVIEGNQEMAKGVSYKKPKLSYLPMTGEMKVINDKYIHIRLNMLLPHCKFEAPEYLMDTLSRIMVDYNKQKELPRFNKAMVVIDEHCNIKNRNVYDQDNKGWKTIPNVIKLQGIISDDDQSNLDICLLSTKSNSLSCNIYIFDEKEEGNFFNDRASGALIL